MAGEDYSVGTKVTADVSNFEKGMNKAEKSLKGFSDKLANSIDRLGKKGLIGSVANVTLAMQGLTKSFNTVIKFAKDVGKAINECTEAYKRQVIAERALNTAIANNPFISGESSKALLQFASDMQKVTNYGDDELIPMMTNLVSLGRTESEVMQIMSVAMDMSAGMGISLDTAITQLNATLNGNIGRLGQQNAELKDLTAEELRSGKAIEILGEKFKGLSGATADTSKQLQNMKGDFKEALGQFTLPSSDMWNKFWTGFYEKGIAVIQKFNDYLDVKIIGKQLVENLYSNARTVAKANKLKVEDVFMDFRYMREELSYLNDSELATLQKTLERQKERTQGEERILSIVKQMLHNKELEADQERKNAEAEAKRAREEGARLAREKELAELRKKQAEEKEKALQLEGQWQDKLLSQQISMLEKEKESAVEGAEERGEATYEIERYYNERLLTLKLEQVKKEREEALKGENVTAEAKIAINEYYDNEVKKIYDDLGKYKKAKKKEEVKEEKKSFDQMLEVAKQYAEKIAGIFSKISGTVKNVFSKVVSGFKSLFEFNVDDALTNLLKFEDSVLTFFIETLPKLPDFFASAMQSVFVLLGTISNFLIKNSDQIIKNITVLVKNVINGIANWVTSGGWQDILQALLVIQTAIENAIADNMEEIANTIRKMLPALIDFLVKSISSASHTLGKIAKSLLPLIADLISAIIEVITSDEVLESSFEAVEGLVDGLVQAIIKLLTKAVPKIINFIIKIMANPSTLIKLTVAIVKGLISAFAKTDWKQVVKDIFMAFIDAFKNLFGIHSPSTLFEGFGLNMVEGLVSGLQGISDAVNTILEPLYKLVTDVFGGIGDFINNSLNVSFKGLSDILDSSGNAFAKITNSVANLVKQLKNLIKELNKATSALFGGGSSGGGNPFSPGGWLDPNPVTNPAMPWNWFAKGSNAVPKGLALVGEAGPELVRFRGGEQVLNNRNTNKALAEMGGTTVNQNITFNNLQDTTAFAMMNQLKQYNRQMAINSII